MEKREQPQVVIGVTGGVAECLDNRADVEYLILDFDHVDEYGAQEDQDMVDTLLKERKFDELSEFLDDFENRMEL